MAQSVERRLGKAEVTGSIPVISFLQIPQRVFFCGLFLYIFFNYRFII